ncbi:hypothetical protein ACQ86K_17610 [Mucilaginibacter sp. P19]|uniref:hypothetical protein n=1 Tax=Mucilaginibacter sp. P19 TaxID=3423947 RepID=UPI003D66AF26
MKKSPPVANKENIKSMKKASVSIFFLNSFSPKYISINPIIKLDSIDDMGNVFNSK